MDERTVDAYNRDAATFAGDWHAQPPASDMHTLIRRFFRPGLTADIGCGSGRDTAWLNENAYPAVGYDASWGLLAEASRLHPGIRFQMSLLPALDGIADGSFANVLCETVIMHMERALIAPSVRRLVSILQPGGTLYLSWRVTDGGDRRDDLGRLYTDFDPDLVLQGLGSAGILWDEQSGSLSSGKLVRRIVARTAGDSSK
jgi:SAM-dependent methyltransferase